MASTPPSNEAFLREVDEELRRDQVKTLWERYGRIAIALIVVALIALGALLWRQNHRQEQRGVEGETMSVALVDLSRGDLNAATTKLNGLATSDADGYRAGAKLALAAVTLDKGDAKGAARQYAAIATDNSFDQPYRDLALIRQTAAEYDSLKPQAVIDRLKPLTVAGTPFFGSAGEMVAIAYMRMGNRKMAGQMFAAVAKDETVPDSIRSRVVQLAGVLGVDVKPAKSKGSS